jgi:hypothetical protein
MKQVARKRQRQSLTLVVRLKGIEDLGEFRLPPGLGAVSAYIDGDLAGFCLVCFRHLDLEYAVAITGANRIRLHGLW